jgi:hypothetical protein
MGWKTAVRPAGEQFERHRALDLEVSNAPRAAHGYDTR